MTLTLWQERRWLMICCQLGRLQLDIAIKQANQPARRPTTKRTA